jgi:hypothetical protein
VCCLNLLGKGIKHESGDLGKVGSYYVLEGHVYKVTRYYLNHAIILLVIPNVYHLFTSHNQTYTKLLRHNGQVLWLLLLNQRNKQTEWKVFLQVAQRLFGVCISVEITE